MNLDTDVLIYIFKYLPLKSNLNLRTVCRRWNDNLKYVFSGMKHLNVSCKRSSQISDIVFMKCYLHDVSPNQMELYLQNLPLITSLQIDVCSVHIKQFGVINLMNILYFKATKLRSCDMVNVLHKLPNAKTIFCDEIDCSSNESTLRMLQSNVLRYKRINLLYTPGPELQLLHSSLEILSLRKALPYGGEWFEWICFKSRSCLRELDVNIRMSLLHDLCYNFPELVSLKLGISHYHSDLNYNPIASLVNLEYLNLEPSGSSVGPYIFDESAACIFKGCKKLRKLKMRYAQIKEKSIRCLSVLENMESINLNYSYLDIEPKIIEILSELKSLKTFIFEGKIPLNSNEHFAYFFRSCPNLTTISIYYITPNTLDNSANVIGQHMYDSCLEKARLQKDKCFKLTISSNTLIDKARWTENCKTFSCDPLDENHQFLSFHGPEWFSLLIC
jgi:F-box domain